MCLSNVQQTTSPDMKRRKMTKGSEGDSPAQGKENLPSTPKKSKVEAGMGEGGHSGEGTSGSSPLSPEQHARMEHSKIQVSRAGYHKELIKLSR